MLHEKPEQEVKYFEGDNWELPTDLSLVPKAADELEKRLAKNNWGDSIDGMSTGLREALINAMVHGNLELTNADRVSPDEQWKEVVNRLNISTEKKVLVDLNITPEEVILKVKDEGKGFNPDEVPDATSPERLLATTGRGLVFMRLDFDEVSFDKPNKTVTLRKFKKDA